MIKNLRNDFIELMSESYVKMPRHDRICLLHAMDAPDNNPATGLPFQTVGELFGSMSDESLATVYRDMRDNELLASRDSYRKYEEAIKNL
jgi:hypothetical protein